MAELPPTHNTETMIEEYTYCRTVARELQGNILRTATLFGIGSVAAIGVVTQAFGLVSVGSEPAQEDSFIGVALVSVLALAGWFTWWRMAERWRSIAYAMIIRMEHLERMGSFRANLYVRRLDDHEDEDKWIDFTNEVKKGSEETPYLPELFEKNLMGFTYQHEKRGIAPMIEFLVFVNVAAWSSLLVWQFVRGLQKLSELDGAIETVNLAFLIPWLGVSVWGFFIYLLNQWRKP